jgi:hypothetical protein
MSYKLQVRVFGRKTDKDLGRRNDHTLGIQKWVNLLSLMLDDFKGKGHCMTMDSAYMGNIMAMIGHEVWGINLVGTAQANHVGANISAKVATMKKGHMRVCVGSTKCGHSVLPCGQIMHL